MQDLLMSCKEMTDFSSPGLLFSAVLDATLQLIWDTGNNCEYLQGADLAPITENTAVLYR